MKNKPQLQDVPVDQLIRGRYQPRREFDAAQLAELAASIRSAGLLQPIIVRPTGTNKFEIIAGERRWRAAQLAGLTEVACLVKNYTDQQAAEAATIENINRVDLNPIEEAQAYQRLLDEFGYLHEEVAAAVGKSRVKITNSLRLLKLAPVVQQMLITGEISEGHGKILASLPAAAQQMLAQKALQQGWSVRQLEKTVKMYQTVTDKDKQFEQRTDVNIKALERNLSSHIGCQTHIDFAAGKGQLKIDFHNLDILDGVLAKLGFNINK